MIKEKIMELLSLVFDIQEHGKGVNGSPYINVELSNYTKKITILIREKGFSSCEHQGEKYEFYFDGISERTYQNCKQHLKDLLETVHSEQPDLDSVCAILSIEKVDE